MNLITNSSAKQYVIDTYAWVEYWIGSSEGSVAKEYIEGGYAFTPSIVVAELRKWFLKEIEAGRRREQEMQKHFAFLESKTQVLDLNYSLATKTGETDFIMKKRKENWPISDSIVLTTARARSAYVVSGDPHFKSIEDVIFIGKD